MADNITVKDAAGNNVVLATQEIAGVHYQRTAHYDPPTFYAFFDRIAPAQNKYMASLWNGSSTHRVLPQQIWRLNHQVAAVTGVALEQYLAFITARTLGTGITIRPYDDSDALPAGVTASHNDSAVTERDIVQRLLAVSEEGSALGTALGEDFLAMNRNFQLIWERTKQTKGFVLKQNQGIALRNVTSSTVGTVSYFIELTTEPNPA